MESSLLTPTQKYAAAALFTLALHQSQIHRTRHSNLISPINSVGEGVSYSESVSVSDHPQLWVSENSGLLLPVFSSLGVDDQACDWLKETARVSSEVGRHVEAFLALLSDETDGTSSERMSKELALTKTVDAVVLNMESAAVSFGDSCGNDEYDNKCHAEYSNNNTKSDSEVTVQPRDIKKGTSLKMSIKDKAMSGSGNRFSEQQIKEETHLTCQRKVTVLYELLSACVTENINVEEKCFREKGYDARHRVALRLLSVWLNVKWIKMEAIETIVACSLVASQQERGEKEDENRNSESPWTMWKRGGIIGAAALTGGALMAITGGLAAPAIAHGLGALAPTLGGGFATAASAAGSTAGSIAVAASFGAAGAGLTGSKMARRIGSLDEFEFKVVGKNHNHGRLAVGIMVSGLVFEEEDFCKPWEGHKDNLERYALQWESNNLIPLSTAIEDWLTSRVAMELMKNGAMMTVLSTLLSALAWPATLVSASDLIDNQLAVAIDRSDKAGKLLAEILLKRLQGKRPVTLVGFSLGARVIFRCLQHLAEAGDNAGIVERVVLLGAPISIKDEDWENARKMAAGRFVNAYSTNDWMLGIAFRASLLSKGLAGIQPVDISGIENVDVTELIEGHSSYIRMARQILEQIDLESYYPVFRTTCTKPQ